MIISNEIQFILLFVCRSALGLPPLFFYGDKVEDISLPLISLYMLISLVFSLCLLFYWLDRHERNDLLEPWWNPILVMFFWIGTMVLSFTALFAWTPIAWIGIPILLDAVWSWEGYVRHEPYLKKVPFDANVF